MDSEEEKEDAGHKLQLFISSFDQNYLIKIRSSLTINNIKAQVSELTQIPQEAFTL